MDAAASLNQGHVVGKNHHTLSGLKGMSIPLPLKLTSLDCGHNLPFREASGGHHLVNKALCHDPDLFLAPVIHLYSGVGVLGMHGNGQVGGQGPGGGGPYHEVGCNPLYSWKDLTQITLCWELHIDGRRCMIRILHLCLCKGGFALNTPIDGLQPLFHKAFLKTPAELSNYAGLIGIVHGDVGVLPVSHHSQALKLIPLDLYELVSIVAAQATNLCL